MTTIEKTIIDGYFLQLERLSNIGKLELIERLTKSVKKNQQEKINKKREELFYKSCGSFISDKTSDEIIAEIKSSRRFRNKEINL